MSSADIPDPFGGPPDADAFLAQLNLEAVEASAEQTEFETIHDRMEAFLLERGIVIPDEDERMEAYLSQLKELFTAKTEDVEQLDESLTLALISPDEFKHRLSGDFDQFTQARRELINAHYQAGLPAQALRLIAWAKQQHDKAPYRSVKRHMKQAIQVRTLSYGLDGPWIELIDKEFKGRLSKGRSLDAELEKARIKKDEDTLRLTEAAIEVYTVAEARELRLPDSPTRFEKEHMMILFIAKSLDLFRTEDQLTNLIEDVKTHIIKSVGVENAPSWIVMVDKLFTVEDDNSISGDADAFLAAATADAAARTEAEIERLSIEARMTKFLVDRGVAIPEIDAIDNEYFSQLRSLSAIVRAEYERLDESLTLGRINADEFEAERSRIGLELTRDRISLMQRSRNQKMPYLILRDIVIAKAHDIPKEEIQACVSAHEFDGPWIELVDLEFLYKERNLLI